MKNAKIIIGVLGMALSMLDAGAMQRGNNSNSNEALQAQIARLQAQVAQMEEQNAQLEEQNARLWTQLEERDARITGLGDEINTDIADMRRSVNKIKEEHRRRKAAIMEAAAALRTTMGDERDIEARIDELKRTEHHMTREEIAEQLRSAEDSDADREEARPTGLRNFNIFGNAHRNDEGTK